MTTLRQREKMILSKYMQAEDVRETHKIIKDTLEIMKYQPKMKLYNISKYQLELENRLVDAWREKQQKLTHFDRKQQLQSIDSSTVLHRKIRKEMKVQQEKFVRNERPDRPKLEPLPYLKKIRQNLNRSMECVEVTTPKREPSPEDTYIMKRVQFELVNNAARRSPVQRQEMKKFYADIKAKVQIY